jgi:hypothetical protein
LTWLVLAYALLLLFGLAAHGFSPFAVVLLDLLLDRGVLGEEEIVRVRAGGREAAAAAAAAMMMGELACSSAVAGDEPPALREDRAHFACGGGGPRANDELISE